MDELARFGNRLEKVIGQDAINRMRAKAGAAGKKAALDTASASLGGDRAMSNFRGGRVKLGAGYDLRGSSEVTVNFRPAGLWTLASAGRRSSGQIRPKRRGGKRAVLTPQGPRARSSYRPSRGLRTYESAVRRAQTDIPKAAFRQFQDEIRRVVH